MKNVTMQQQKKGGSFVKRHIMAAAVLPVFFCYIYYLPPSPYFLVLLLFAAITALWEFYVMYRVPARLYVPSVIIGAVLFYATCLYPEYAIYGFSAGLFLLLLLRLFLVKTPSGCMTDTGPLSLGLFYVTFFLSFQWFIRTGANGLELLLLLYLSVWLADGMAYYIGTYLGRTKLYPTISPNKTVEGAAGSIIGGMSGGLIIQSIYHLPGLSLAGAAATGAVLGLAALIGDLIESMFKRDAGVKDSSNIFPGHGGILDKLDGFFIAGPVLYIIVRYF